MVITIGGEYGSGAKRVAEEVAKELGYMLCNDEIIDDVIRELGLTINEGTFNLYDESTGSESVASLQRWSNFERSGFIDELTFTAHETPLDEDLKYGQKAAINRLADKGNIIILGRCADYYLKDRPNVMKLWCFNTLEKRVARVSQFFSISEKEALKRVKKTDKHRAEYYQYFTDRKWTNFTNYDFIINLDSISIQRCIEVVKQLVKIDETVEVSDPKVGAPRTPNV